MILVIIVLFLVGWFFRRWGSACATRARFMGVGTVIDPSLYRAAVVIVLLGSLMWLVAFVMACMLVWRYLP